MVHEKDNYTFTLYINQYVYIFIYIYVKQKLYNYIYVIDLNSLLVYTFCVFHFYLTKRFFVF